MQVVSHSVSPRPLQEFCGLSGVGLGHTFYDRVRTVWPLVQEHQHHLVSRWYKVSASPRPPASETVGQAHQSASSYTKVPDV